MTDGATRGDCSGRSRDEARREGRTCKAGVCAIQGGERDFTGNALVEGGHGRCGKRRHGRRGRVQGDLERIGGAQEGVGHTVDGRATGGIGVCLTGEGEGECSGHRCGQSGEGTGRWPEGDACQTEVPRRTGPSA
ncbi:MAG: hypothetical protein EBT22_10815 [Chloroflexi bacterium]|nr:hypothetical protein [Chloroflexota bacterium]